MKINNRRKFVLFISLVLLIVFSGFILLNKSSMKNKQIHKKIKINDLNLPSNKIPSDFKLEYIIDRDKVVLTKDNYVWIYNSNTGEAETLTTSLYKNNYIYTIKYFDKWIVWAEQSDDEMGSNWCLVAKNIESNEEIIVDKSRKRGNISYLYSPGNIEIFDKKIAYRYTDYENNKNIGLIKLFDLETRKATIVEKIIDIEDKFIGKVAIYNDKIVWTNPHTLSSDGNRKYSFSDLYMYDINSKEKKKLIDKKYLLNSILYKDEVYAINYMNDIETEIVRININNGEMDSIINKSSSIYSYMDDSDYFQIYEPIINNNILTWIMIGVPNKYYYDLNDNTFKTIDGIDYITGLSKEYIYGVNMTDNHYNFVNLNDYSKK